MSRFTRSIDFAGLSLRDLADARDAHHVHLAKVQKAVGMALGRYLVRRDDPRFKDPDAEDPSWSSKPRILANSWFTSGRGGVCWRP